MNWLNTHTHTCWWTDWTHIHLLNNSDLQHPWIVAALSSFLSSFFTNPKYLQTLDSVGSLNIFSSPFVFHLLLATNCSWNHASLKEPWEHKQRGDKLCNNRCNCVFLNADTLRLIRWSVSQQLYLMNIEATGAVASQTSVSDYRFKSVNLSISCLDYQPKWCKTCLHTQLSPCRRALSRLWSSLQRKPLLGETDKPLKVAPKVGLCSSVSCLHSEVSVW